MTIELNEVAIIMLLILLFILIDNVINPKLAYTEY